MVMDKVYYLEDINNEQDYIYLEIISQLQKQNNHDALAFIFYIVMLECGFTLKESDNLPTYNCKTIAEHLQSYESSLLIKKNNVYNVVMYVNKIRCNLDLLVFSNALIANLSVPQYHILKSKAYHCIDVTKYEQIRSVCLDLKQKIVMPVRTLALDELSTYYASLRGMPYDVLVYIIKNYLNLQDFMNLVKTCKQLNNLVHEQTLWIHFCKRENVTLDKGENPKNLFKCHWLSKNSTNRFYHFDVY
ncbi:uncharacterized protein LOC108252479 [Diaphorina citri]|uniref:Uncharacterized protein LOC108252479 n=1 Tax=Diaphorina citri TaxID=121845 RepID=A0A1S4ECP3_DIACI|nr:uncharacterized protein LOC108252479 [Diaphorina citri]KAI5749291.1 hypothetical protein M8J76_006190 [Diaphorina citri]